MRPVGVEQNDELVRRAIRRLADEGNLIRLAVDGELVIWLATPSKFLLNATSQSGVGCTSFISLSHDAR